ncbi:MAG: hypothetical protein V2A34_10100, partial [Lentisphaerota bacterium]
MRTSPLHNNLAWQQLGGVVLLVGLVCLLYLPVADYDFVTFDDPHYVVTNPFVNQGVTWQGLKWLPRGMVSSQWHPVTMLSHMLDCELFGLSAGRHHMVNVAWHAANTALLFLLMLSLTGQFMPCFLLALCWCIHPLAVDSVAWISQRKNLLSMFFGLSALWMYSLYARTQRRTCLGFALILFFIGLMAKATLIVFPLLLLLWDFWPLQRAANPDGGRWFSSPLLREKTPFFLLSLFFSLAILRSQSAGGTVAAAAAYPLGWRLSFTLDNYVHYVTKFILPVDLVAIYPWPRAALPWSSLGFDAAVFLGISALVYRFRDRRYLVAGWLWFIAGLLPVCGMMPAGAAIKADRFTYLPLIGLIMMLVWAGWEWSLRRRSVRIAWTLLSCLALLVLGLLTRRQLPTWSNGGALYAHALSVNPDNPTALNNMGMWQRNHGDIPGALRLFSEAVDIEPRHYLAQNNLAEL